MDIGTFVHGPAVDYFEVRRCDNLGYLATTFRAELFDQYSAKENPISIEEVIEDGNARLIDTSSKLLVDVLPPDSEKEGQLYTIRNRGVPEQVFIDAYEGLKERLVQGVSR